MSTTYTQEHRLLQIETPLGPDALLLTRLSGAEEMSRLFRYRLDLISENHEITAKDLVGQDVTMTVRRSDGAKTYFNGYVSRFAAGGKDDRGFRQYRAEVVPWLWFLTRTSNCRIFQNKTLPEIVEEVFGLWGYTDFETSEIGGHHPQWEYCVQYRETDFNFISRLLEQAGIFFYFRHEEGKHTLVLGDKTSAYADADPAEVEYADGIPDRDFVSEWEHHYEFRPGKWAMTDYNFLTPSTSLLSNTGTLVDLPDVSNYEMFDYPGEYPTRGDGDEIIKVRMEEDEVAHEVVDGRSTCRQLVTGHKFTLSRHSIDSEVGKEYLPVRVFHEASDDSYEVSSPDARYHNEFTAIPSGTVFRPQRITPKPRVHGTQPATVVGEGEIAADEYGRVQVKFPWIRAGVGGDEVSCWIRVAQNWAGNKWGVLFNPRVGQEVVVAFDEGDPDRPLIIGRVYNAEQMPPYDPKSEGTISTIKTRSSEGGSPDTFNEVRFEDKKGSEELYFHAEKDQTIVVENDRVEGVGNDRSLTVDRDKSEEIHRNKSIQVDGEHSEVVSGGMSVTVGSSLTENVAVNYAETVGAAMQLTVGGALSISAGAAMAEIVGAAKTEAIGGLKSEAIGADKTLTVGSDLKENVGGSRTINVAKDVTSAIKGQHKESVTKEFILNADKVQIVAKKEISIKTGSAEILLKKNGDINIKGKKINIKGSGDVIVKGSKIKEN